MKRGWKVYLLYASIIIVGGFLLFETVRLKNTGFEGKSLWGWMELLIIPAVLAIGAIFLNRSERALERKTAEDRAKLERELATDRQQEAALQAYIDRMGDLLLEKKLRTTKNKEVRNVARIRTLTVLRGLDANRKALVIKFLNEAELITRNKTIVNLNGADLKGANLSDANIQFVELFGADLRGANLKHTNLHGANLIEANLADATMAVADLTNAVFGKAYLFGAELVLAKINDADLTNADLSEANLNGARLSNARLIGANLQGASLVNADLRSADLKYSRMMGADLTYSLLENANFKFAKVSREQIETANWLTGAIMPDGTKHE